jgi:hypothetical protein
MDIANRYCNHQIGFHKILKDDQYSITKYKTLARAVKKVPSGSLHNNLLEKY